MEPDPREERLPKWAREALAGLRRKAQAAEDSDVIIDPYDETPIRLGKGTRVRFVLGAGWEHYIEVRTNSGALELHAGTAMAFYPHVTNLAHVKLNRTT
jgi:hypothetical protein